MSMILGLGLGASARPISGGGGSFDPATLFASSEVGDWWLDGTRYQESTKSTVSGVGDPVGAIVGTVNGVDLIQATSARRPTNAANSLLTLGGSHGLYIPSLTLASDVATFCVAVSSASSADEVLVELTENMSGKAGAFLAYTDGTGRLQMAVADTGGARTEAVTGFVAGAPHVVFIQFDNSTPDGDLLLWYSGVEQSLTTLGTGKTGFGDFLAAQSFNVGLRDAGGTPSVGMNGSICPVMLINRALTSDERSDIVTEVTAATGIS